MTVVPADDGQTLSLVCDACGQAVQDIECPLQQWPVVWAVVRRTGWSGSPLAIGPHHCAHCRADGPAPPAAHARTRPVGDPGPVGAVSDHPSPHPSTQAPWWMRAGCTGLAPGRGAAHPAPP